MSEPEPSREDLKFAVAEQRSFIGPAAAVFILYYIFYIPGLIFNILWLKEAEKVESITGKPPAGKGCLLWLLVAGIIPLILTINIAKDRIDRYRTEQMNQEMMRRFGPVINGVSTTTINGVTTTTQKVKQSPPQPPPTPNQDLKKWEERMNSSSSSTTTTGRVKQLPPTPSSDPPPR